MNQEIIVEGGRKVEVNKLIQWRTYAGVVEGSPTASLNRSEIEKAVNTAKVQCYLDAVFVVESKLTPVAGDKLYPEEEKLAKLPRITCIARLHDYGHYEDADYAALAVVWFQNNFAFPIDFEVLDQMKQIPFSKLAKQFDFF
jgi:hypothetical protein